MSQKNADYLLDQIIVALREEPIPELPEPLVTSATVTNRQRRLPSAAVLGSVQGRTRRRLWVVLAAFAALMMLVIASPTIMPGGRQSAAFAEVQKSVSAYKSVRYRILDFRGNKDPYVTTVVAVRGIGSHGEASNASEQITNLKARRMLWVDHRARKAKLYEIYPDGGSESTDQFHEKLRNLPADAKPLGEAEVDGRKVVQFEFKNHGTFVVAVDPGTKLPLRMEFTSDGAQRGGVPFREVITDFLFDAPANESLFELNIPAGYIVERCEEPPNRKPIDMKSLVVSPTRGIGPMPLGASKQQVIAAFGQPDWIELEGRFAGAYSAPGKPAGDNQAEITLERFHYNSLGFELSVSSAKGVTQFRTLYVGLLARPFLGKTDAGIALGASIDDVVRVYGPPERKSGFRDDVLDYFHKGWTFVFYDGKLSWFTASAPMSDRIEIEVHDDGTYTERVKPEKQSK